MQCRLRKKSARWFEILCFLSLSCKFAIMQQMKFFFLGYTASADEHRVILPTSAYRQLYNLIQCFKNILCTWEAAPMSIMCQCLIHKLPWVYKRKTFLQMLVWCLNMDYLWIWHYSFMFINVCTKYKLLSPHFDVQPPTPFPRFTKLV